MDLPSETEYLMKEKILLGDGRYNLVPLKGIRRDSVPSLLGSKPGVYICSCPTSEWHEHFGLNQTLDVSPGKKRLMFAQMGENSQWVSPTNVVAHGNRTRQWREGPILHLGYGPLKGRFAQVVQTIELLWWLIEHRAEYSYCFVYNFYLPYYLAPLIMKTVLQKKLYVEYEDDYTLKRKSTFKNGVEKILRRTVNGAVCVHEDMAPKFHGIRTVVVNALVDLSYAKDIRFSFHDGMTFLFGGSLDEIRGVDLIPELVMQLQKQIRNFQIFITGSGPLESAIESWNIPEVKFLGFLDSKSYARLVEDADVCLVLQKPDHPFSRGSYPSKIVEYAQHHKPIYSLVLREGT